MHPDEARDRLTRALALPGGASSDYDLNPDIALPADRPMRDAGVLVGVDVTGPVAQVILTRRSAQLRHHPGQVAFPGGKVDPGDGGPVGAALRESHEEIGLPPGSVTVLGEMPAHDTVTGFRVVPVVGLVTRPFTPVPEVGEVDEVFRVPLSHLADARSFRIESRRWQGRRRYFYAVPYGPWYIWGATARILRALADRMDR